MPLIPNVMQYIGGMGLRVEWNTSAMKTREKLRQIYQQRQMQPLQSKYALIGVHLFTSMQGDEQPHHYNVHSGATDYDSIPAGALFLQGFLFVAGTSVCQY